MELHTLRPAINATKSSKRIGRGQGSGKGGTATKGHKGAQSRSGYKRKKGFEGGQNPLQRRVPKFGNQKRKFKPLSVIDLQSIANYALKHKIDEVGHAELINWGLTKGKQPYKILGKGNAHTEATY